jgi:hypothetical protein
LSVYSDVRTSIRKGALVALSEFTNPQVIFSHSNGAEPAESYVVINILQVEQVGKGYTSTLVNELDELTIQANYNIYAQFSFVGSKSGEMSQVFTQQLNNVLVREELQRNSLNLRTKTNIRRAPQKRDTKWVEYHNMDVVFTYAVNTQQIVDVVEAVIIVDELTGEVFTVPPDFIITP